jgi:GDP-L-fucose synthase
MPTNLYGPGDNYHPENSHVIPALIRRFHEAKAAGADKVVIWGTGSPRREFLYVDDMADASVHVMELDRATYDLHTTPTLSHINVGTGDDVTIREVAEIIGKAVGFTGEIGFDLDKPDGTPRKLMDTAKLSSLGWKPGMSLEEGIRKTYEHFVRDVVSAESSGTGSAERLAETLMAGLRTDAVGKARTNIIHSTQP